MKVAVIAPTWLPVPAPAYGGTEAVVDQLARGLQAAGHDVLLVGHPDSTCPVPRASVIPAEDTLRMGRASIELEYAIGAYDLVRDCDVVHDHTLAGPMYSHRFADLAVVATNHNPFTRTMNAVFGAAVPHAGIVAISRSHAASTDLPIAAVVHHGVDIADFPAGAGDGGYAAVLSRMAPDKGIHRAIAVARAAGVPLKIAAKMREPREHEYFEERIRPLLGGDVEYLGELDRIAKLEFLGSAVALLNPIEWREPFGMVSVEAMACGTPVVGTPRGATPEIVEHGVTGFLSEDDGELAEALADISTVSRAACREHVARNFSVGRMVDGYLRVYRDRIERRAGAARTSV